MNTNQTYDFIIIDAFSTGWCAPDSFINIKFVKKVKELLNWNGIVIVNTLIDCDKHFYQLSLFQSIFDNLYTSHIVDTNQEVIAIKGYSIPLHTQSLDVIPPLVFNSL